MTGQPPARLRVGVIGAGRAGSVLGAALDRAGHRVVAVHAVSRASQARAEALLPGAVLADPPQVLAGADLVLLTVPDDVLVGLVDGLALGGHIRPGTILVHASGALGTGRFAAATAAGALVLALHPAMTLTGTAVDVARLAGCPFAITCAEPARPIAEALVVEMGGEPVWVPEGARPLYHAALAHAANHLVTLLADAMEVLDRCGIEQPARLLAPLAAASLDNVLRTGDAALTGPVSRGDAGTVAAHLAALDRLEPAIAAGYRTMARRTADRAIAAGRLGPQQGADLLQLLADP